MSQNQVGKMVIFFLDYLNRNRCWKTGRPRAIFQDFGLSRHVFREMAHNCFLPGVTKSSW